MPPKFKKLRQQVEKEKEKKKKKAKKIRPRKKRRAMLYNVRRLKGIITEDTTMRNFLSQNKDVADEEKLIQDITLFIKASNDSYIRRARFIFFFKSSGVLTLLSVNRYREFVNAFLEQPTSRTARMSTDDGTIREMTISIAPKDVEEFWSNYRQRPMIKLFIKSRAEQLRKDNVERRRLEKIIDQFNLEEEVDEQPPSGHVPPWGRRPDDGPPPPPPPPPTPLPTPRKPPGTTPRTASEVWASIYSKPRVITPSTTIMVNIGKDGQMVDIIEKKGEPEKQELSMFDKNVRMRKCMTELAKAPWLDVQKVKNVFISYSNPAQRSDDLSMYAEIDKSIQVTIATGEKLKVFRARPSFFKLLCGRQSGRNTQNGQVLDVYTSIGRIESFYIVYQVVQIGGVKNLIQDEEMVEKRSKWRERQRDTQKERLKMMLNEQVDTDLIRLGTRKLSEVLKGVGMTKWPAFSEEVSNEIAKISVSNKEYIARLARILAYVGNRSGDPSTSAILRTRLQEGWYRPDIFVSLTPQQMFPEVTMSGANARSMLSKQHRVEQLFVESFYQIKYPTQSIRTNPTPPSLHLPPLSAEKLEIDTYSFWTKTHSEPLGPTWPRLPRKSKIFKRIQDWCINKYGPNWGKDPATKSSRIKEAKKALGKDLTKDLRKQWKALSKEEKEEWRKRKEKAKRCVNQDDIASIPDHRIIRYTDKEDGTMWCLDIEYIKSEYIKSPQVINPSTGRMLAPKFVTMIVETFGDIDWEDEEEPSPPELAEEVISTPPEEMLAPGLIRLVLENIDDCRRELDDDELDDGRCPAMDNTDDADEEGSTTGETDDTGSTTDGTDSDDDEGGTTGETDSDDDAPPLTSGDSFSPRTSIFCNYCRNTVGPNPINTIEEGQDGYYRQVRLCSKKCGEEYNFYTKKRKKKRKKKRTSPILS
jgi:hypothetical protein